MTTHRKERYEVKERAYNFNAGPALLPLEVINKAAEAIANYNQTGIGIMELSHRSPEFHEIITTAEGNLRKILDIPDEYGIVFMGGGATTQFSMAPMNLLRPGREANYLLSGTWAEKAFEEAAKFGKVHAASSSKDRDYAYIPHEIDLSPNPDYVHFTSNNTIVGTQYPNEPAVSEIPLVCDASSDLLYKKIDVRKYGLIYAGAQKNLGPAGVTVVIIRRDLLERSPQNLATYLNYHTQVDKKSLLNTPPTFAVFVLGEVLKWVLAEGGLSVIEVRNQRKAAMLYDVIDSSGFYRGVAERHSRSLMNVTFRLEDPYLEAEFVAEAAERNLVQLKGHRSVGGLRASIYNAFPEEGVAALVSFMQEFERKRG
jgi:phosphoserine aminotransferase